MKNSNTSIYLILIVILGFMVYNVMFMKGMKSEFTRLDSKIDSIQVNIDSFNLAITELDLKLQSLNADVDVIDGDIDNIRTKIKNIKRRTDETVNSIDTFTLSELVGFLSNRYITVTDTIRFNNNVNSPTYQNDN